MGKGKLGAVAAAVLLAVLCAGGIKKRNKAKRQERERSASVSTYERSSSRSRSRSRGRGSVSRSRSRSRSRSAGPRPVNIGWRTNLLDTYPSKRESVEWEHPYAPKKSALSKKNKDIYTHY